jgi:hypothetical protein
MSFIKIDQLASIILIPECESGNIQISIFLIFRGIISLQTIQLFWVMMPYRDVVGYQRFGRLLPPSLG